MDGVWQMQSSSLLTLLARLDQVTLRYNAYAHIACRATMMAAFKVKERLRCACVTSMVG